MNWDFFMYAETRQRPWRAQVKRGAVYYRLRLPANLTLAQAIIAAHRAGVPQGSNRSGVFEVQNDNGIFSRKDGRNFGRINPSTATFSKF